MIGSPVELWLAISIHVSSPLLDLGTHNWVMLRWARCGSALRPLPLPRSGKPHQQPVSALQAVTVRSRRAYYGTHPKTKIVRNAGVRTSFGTRQTESEVQGRDKSLEEAPAPAKNESDEQSRVFRVEV